MKTSQKKIKLRISADFGGAWLWDSNGICISLDTYLPESPQREALNLRFEEWQSKYEGGEIVLAESSPNFGWKTWHDEGIQLAHALKEMFREEIELVFCFGYEDPERWDIDNDKITIE